MGIFRKKNGKKFRILSIDGGGMKGVFTAFALMKLEEDYDIKILDYFDMIVGTSTGALITSSLLKGKPAKEIFGTYIDEENPIFSSPKSFREQFGSIFYAGFNVKGLENELLNEFPIEFTLNDLYKTSKKKTFAIFSTNFTKAKPIIYTSPNIIDKDNGMIKNNSTLFEALRTSTAAPFYFEPFIDKNTNNLILDGGLWANNPSLAGINLCLAQDPDLKSSEIEVLSFGQTFTNDIEYKLNSGKEVLKNPMKNQIVQLLLSVLTTNQNAQTDQVNHLLGKRHYRYSPEIEQKGVSVNKINTRFLNYSKIYWEQNKDSLVQFIKTGINTKK